MPHSVGTYARKSGYDGMHQKLVFRVQWKGVGARLINTAISVSDTRSVIGGKVPLVCTIVTSNRLLE